MRKRWIISLAILTLLGCRLVPKAPILSDMPWSTAVYASGGELLRLSLSRDEQYRLWIPLEAISPSFVEAIMLYEDKWFDRHVGINPIALIRAGFRTGIGQRRQGGSTLSMQLARRLYHIDSRNLRGKGQQILGALWLELRYSKHDILEAYLNVAPFGGNIEGIGAASLIYFHTSAKNLSLPEAIALAVIPQNPQRRKMTAGRNNVLQQKARERLWQQWMHAHPKDQHKQTEHSLALHNQARAQLPFYAPHTVDKLLKDNAFSHSREIHSSIDLRLQQLVERIIHDYLRTRTETGINNASALLLDSTTLEVKAAVGSANYADASISGQVNGILAKRSPGSTLKPFIYALALDQGILHPQTLLKDVPTSFGAFSPENFDGRFIGPLSAQEALIRSRNIPAVSVAAQLSKPNFYQFLKQAGISRLASPEHYGLALVLGGGEVTMEELAQLYAMLANGGIWQTLLYQPAPKYSRTLHSNDLRLLSEEAAFITLDMLQHTIRPDTSEVASPPIAWKTGTSWGFRDAWTAGVFGRYVLVVWLGRFDSASNPALIGIEAAAPLFLRIVDAIRAEHLDRGFIRHTPPNLSRVEICASSGDFPDELCPVKTNTWFIPGKSPIQSKHLHRTIWIDKQTGKITCHATAHSEKKVIENWSSDLQHVFSAAGLPQPIQPHCSADESGDIAPHITSPLRSVTYSIRPSKPEKIMLRAEASGDIQQLFWFIDNQLIGHSRAGETLLWQPTAPRNYTVRVVDDKGRADSRKLYVTYIP